MLSFDPKEIPTKDLHQYLLGSVAPIAPYSFFNAFSSNPPILVFSSNRKVVDNTTKDTLHNIQETGEVVINVVNHAIVRQMAVTSISFPTEVSEFDKSGLTPIPSEVVKPFRIKESPAQMECTVRDIITLGDQGGAGHLIICDVVRMHISKDVIDDRNRIDPHKIDLMGRMGRAFYVRASGDAIQTIIQPVMKQSIGYDQLPKSIRDSSVLTGNNIGQLAGVLEWPDKESLTQLKESNATIQHILTQKNPAEALHQFAKKILEESDDRDTAIKALLIADEI